MRFEIQPSSAEPIYRQIVAQVRRQVASGQWPAGTPLPSVRALAQEHAINPMTVSKAYSLLEAEGLLERRRGMGMVIAERQAARHPVYRLALLEPALRSAVQQAAQLGIGDGEAMALFGRLLAEREPTGPAGSDRDIGPSSAGQTPVETHFPDPSTPTAEGDLP